MAQNFVPDVIYEDNHLLVVNKPAGMLVQGDNTGDIPIIDHYKAYVKEKYNKPGNVFLGLVHRLDRPVSGVMVLAKTSKAMQRLNKQFKNKHPEKIYHAIVKQMPPKKADHLENYLKKNHVQNKSYVVDQGTKESKLAELKYEHLASSDTYHLLKIQLLTGRHHQIRCQLAHCGCPIKGDLKYGFARSNKDGSISLHASALSLEHPVRKEEFTFTAPFPDTDVLWNLFRKFV
jgi:23S rRNA pseudouridine1911/1915/1917 synthase